MTAPFLTSLSRLLICGCFVLTVLPALEAHRALGVGAHWLPQRIATLMNSPAGLVIRKSPHLRAIAEPEVVLSTVASTRAFLQAQEATVSQQGLWIVTTHPSAYSADERAFMERLHDAVLAAGIPFFVCRGSALPDGWVRLDAHASWLDHDPTAAETGGAQ